MTIDKSPKIKERIANRASLKGLRRFFIEKRYNFIFIDLDNPKRVDASRIAAKKSVNGILPGLRSTESNFQWALLYDHARAAQIRPLVMHRMRRSDLEFLAGMSLPHPELSAPKANWESKKNAGNRYEQQTKLQGNALRAQGILTFRNILWAGMLAAAATLCGVWVTKLLK